MNYPPINQEQYAKAMREALSNKQMINEDLTINHTYFNVKKGHYWSEKHYLMLGEGLLKYGPDWLAIRQNTFNKQKSQVQIELRSCLLLNVKDTKQITKQKIQNVLGGVEIRTERPKGRPKKAT